MMCIMCGLPVNGMSDGMYLGEGEHIHYTCLDEAERMQREREKKERAQHGKGLLVG